MPAAGVERIALGRGALEPELVGSAGQRERECRIQAHAHAGEPLGAEEPLVDQRVLGFGQRVEVPAVEVADLLAELADVHPQAARQASPVDVSLLDSHLLVFERQEDPGVGVRVEGRLKRHLELAGDAIVALATLPGDQPDVAGGTDLGIED